MKVDLSVTVDVSFTGVDGEDHVAAAKQFLSVLRTHGFKFGVEVPLEFVGHDDGLDVYVLRISFSDNAELARFLATPVADLVSRRATVDGMLEDPS